MRVPTLIWNFKFICKIVNIFDVTGSTGLLPGHSHLFLYK